MGRLIIPSFCILISVIYFIYTINLPKAKLGDPNAPMYFPLIVSIFLFIMSVIYFVKEFLKHYPKNEEVKLLFKGRAPLLIVSTIIICFIYTFLFERLGYLISTMIFMLAILFIVNGRKKWLVNILVGVLFSAGSWYVFYHLLDVSLP